MNSKTIEVKKDDLQTLYEVLTNYPAISKEQVVNEMHKCFGEDIFKPKYVTERIKTFEDACNELGEAHPLVLQYRFNYNNEDGWNDDGYTSDFESYLKLRIIAAALNEGWEPQFTEDEWRYFPWFELYTQKEIDEMDEEQKNRVVYRSFYSADAHGGVAYAYAGSDSSNAYTSIGSRLAFKTRELAEYAGKQFIEIWADYVFKPNGRK